MDAIVVNTASVDCSNVVGIPQVAVTGSAAFTRGSGSPVLSLIKRAGTTDFHDGEDTVFTFTVANSGDGTAFNIVVLDTLPSLLSFVAGSAMPAADSGWNPQAGSPERVRWSIATLSPGASLTLRLVARARTLDGIDHVVVNSGIVHYSDSAGTARPPATSFDVVRIRAGVSTVVRLIVEVFDSSGRLLRTLKDGTSAGGVGLRWVANGSDFVEVSTGDIVTIELSDGRILTWDTRDEDGGLMPNGFYTVRVTSRMSDGREDVSSRTFTLSRLVDNVILFADAIPNPAASVVWISFALVSPQVVMDVKIYNVAGEIVRKARAVAGSRSFKWDLRNKAGTRVAKGLYLIVLDARDSTSGARERMILKLAVMSN